MQDRLLSLFASWRRLNVVFGVFFVLAGLVYVGQTWSPSCYGFVLQQIGAEDGVVWGHPRQIRSDEWSVVTPLTQATVNNGFKRFNETSYYHEDLRINYSLPIRDWALVFKPTYWPYLFVNPAYAFSFHFYALMVLFVFGYAHLFRRMGASPAQSFLFSGGLFFTGYVQFWWNEKGPVFAIFPWLLVVLFSRLPLWGRTLLFYWVATCWLLENFYPPLFVSLGFVALILVLAYRPDLLRGRTVVVIAFAGLAANGTALAYLWDYIMATATTIYPGSRVMPGGGIPWEMMLAQIWPAGMFDSQYNMRVADYHPWIPNICEVGSVGLYFVLAALCFANWSALRDGFSWRRDRTLLLLIAGTLATTAWVFLPVPAWAGKFLLWDHVPPNRMRFASGLLFAIAVFELIRKLGLRFDGKRLLVYVGVLVLGWLGLEFFLRQLGAGHWQDRYDLLILPLVFAIYPLVRRAPQHGLSGLLAVSLLVGMVVFGRFNPVQKAWPIFNRTPTLYTRALAANTESNGVLAVQDEMLIGATLNGLGFRAVTHLTAVPQLPLWHQRFPDMSAEAFNEVFNRYAHIRLLDEPVPRLMRPDELGVPVSAFRGQIQARVLADRPAGPVVRAGYVDRVQSEGDVWILAGWVPWHARGAQRQLFVVGAPGLSVQSVFDVPRRDVLNATNDPQRLLSGFSLRIKRSGGTPETSPLCLYARDGDSGPWVLLQNPDVLPYCGDAAVAKNLSEIQR